MDRSDDSLFRTDRGALPNNGPGAAGFAMPSRRSKLCAWRGWLRRWSSDLDRFVGGPALGQGCGQQTGRRQVASMSPLSRPGWESLTADRPVARGVRRLWSRRISQICGVAARRGRDGARVRIAIAVVAALCAAVCFALGSLVQQGAARQADPADLALRIAGGAGAPTPVAGWHGGNRAVVRHPRYRARVRPAGAGAAAGRHAGAALSGWAGLPGPERDPRRGS
jgi:hypothetical protein